MIEQEYTVLPLYLIHMNWFNQHIHWYWSYNITNRRNAIGHFILIIDALSVVTFAYANSLVEEIQLVTLHNRTLVTIIIVSI